MTAAASERSLRPRRTDYLRWRLRPSAGTWDHPVTIGPTTLRNPVIASSGTYGYGLEYSDYGDPTLLGAIAVKSLTASPRPGFATPRVTVLDDPGTMVNAIGVPNPGVEEWTRTILPAMVARGAPTVASVWGTSASQVIESATALARHAGPIAWEVNLSCPNSDHGGPPLSHDAEAAARVCREIAAMRPDGVGLWAKLSPDAPDTLSVAEACHDAGADAVVVSNTLPAGPAGIRGPIPLGGGTGGMSGRALRDVVRPLVEKICADAPHVPVIACGGVLDSRIALDYLDLGATAVEIGTASLFDPRSCHKIARGVVTALSARGRR